MSTRKWFRCTCSLEAFHSGSKCSRQASGLSARIIAGGGITYGAKSLEDTLLRALFLFALVFEQTRLLTLCGAHSAPLNNLSHAPQRQPGRWCGQARSFLRAFRSLLFVGPLFTF